MKHTKKYLEEKFHFSAEHAEILANYNSHEEAFSRVSWAIRKGCNKVYTYTNGGRRKPAEFIGDDINAMLQMLGFSVVASGNDAPRGGKCGEYITFSEVKNA